MARLCAVLLASTAPELSSLALLASTIPELSYPSLTALLLPELSCPSLIVLLRPELSGPALTVWLAPELSCPPQFALTCLQVSRLAMTALTEPAKESVLQTALPLLNRMQEVAQDLHPSVEPSQDCVVVDPTTTALMDQLLVEVGVLLTV